MKLYHSGSLLMCKRFRVPSRGVYLEPLRVLSSSIVPFTLLQLNIHNCPQTKEEILLTVLIAERMDMYPSFSDLVSTLFQHHHISNTYVVHRYLVKGDITVSNMSPIFGFSYTRGILAGLSNTMFQNVNKHIKDI